MPLYEFSCPSGHAFEKFYRSIGSAPSEEKCPECGLVAVRRMSAAGLVFKGSGFYITDYGKDGKKDLRGGAAATAGGEAKPDTGGSAADSSTGAGTSDSGAGKSADTPAVKSDSGTKTSTPAPVSAPPAKKPE
jgi:putative FmdB family regulatory protein